MWARPPPGSWGAVITAGLSALAVGMVLACALWQEVEGVGGGSLKT